MDVQCGNGANHYVRYSELTCLGVQIGGRYLLFCQLGAWNLWIQDIRELEICHVYSLCFLRSLSNIFSAVLAKDDITGELSSKHALWNSRSSNQRMFEHKVEAAEGQFFGKLPQPITESHSRSDHYGKFIARYQIYEGIRACFEATENYIKENVAPIMCQFLLRTVSPVVTWNNLYAV